MKGQRIFVTIIVGLLLLALAIGSVLAQESEERTQPQGDVSIEAMVSSKFTYQGMLREDGNPVTGTRDMVFRLHADAACTSQVGSDINMPGVLVADGLFSTELSVPASIFDGDARWLEVEVGGTPIGCQEILPVPYALSLRPGAEISGSQTNWDGLHVENSADTGLSYGVFARSSSTQGRGVFGYAAASSGAAYGVFGQSQSVAGAGVYARGHNEGADLILAGNEATATGDDGRIMSDPAYSSSDIFLITNDGIRIELDADGAGEDSDVEIRNMDGTLIFNVDESGDVTFGGPGMIAFPRPAYDSGWVSLGQGANVVRNHNLGGDADDYVVDFVCQHASYGRHNIGVGGDVGTGYYGAFWRNLTDTSITLERANNDLECPQVRVRIWRYP